MRTRHQLEEVSPGPFVTHDGRQDGKNITGKTSPVRLLAFVLFLAALTAIFGSHLFRLFAAASRSDLNSYIILIPFVAAYLLFIERGRLPRDYGSAVGLAVVPFAIGIAVLLTIWRGERWTSNLSANDYLAWVTFSFVCFVWAGGFLFLGKKWMSAAAFPAAFLVFLIPLPDRVVDLLETGSKLASTEAASWFFNISGTPALREGTVFQLPGIAIQVAQECSGIRSSWILFITSLIAAHLFLTRPWTKTVLVAAVIPLGILRNGFRIFIIGLLCVRVGPDIIHSVLHRKGGPLFFVLSLIPLGLLLWFLRRFRARGIPVRPEGNGVEPSNHDVGMA